MIPNNSETHLLSDIYDLFLFISTMCTPVQLNKLFEFALNILSNSTKVTVDKRFVPFKIVQRERMAKG